MKKILVVLAVMVASTTSVFALDTNKYEVFFKLSNTNTFNSLVRFLDINSDQSEHLEMVFSMTEAKMKSALKAKNETAAEKAMYFNLGNVKYVLSEVQYKKYLYFVNVSLNSEYDNQLANK